MICKKIQCKEIFIVQIMCEWKLFYLKKICYLFLTQWRQCCPIYWIFNMNQSIKYVITDGGPLQILVKTCQIHIEVIHRESSKYRVSTSLKNFILTRGPKYMHFFQKIEFFSRGKHIPSIYRGSNYREFTVVYKISLKSNRLLSAPIV